MTRLLRRVRTDRDRRRGAVLPLVGVLSVVIIGMLAFTIDLGYVSLVRGQMQSGADSASLAAASQLLDPALLGGSGGQSLTAADTQANRFATANKGGGVPLALGSGDVEYGYIADPEDPASPFLKDRQPYNSARVTVRRTDQRNGELGLFFAPIFNHDAVALTAEATATFEGNLKGFKFNPNISNQKCLLLPFTIDVDCWEAAVCGTGGTDAWSHDRLTEKFTPGGDGVREIKLFPTKGTAPGNFGTLDIGNSSNSTSVLERQILNGPTQADFDAVGGKIELDDGGTLVLEGDTGISAGFKEELHAIRGKPRIIPLYRAPVTGEGDNSRFTIVRWVGCVILDVDLTGEKKSVIIQPQFAIDSTAYGGGPVSDHSFALRPLRLTR